MTLIDNVKKAHEDGLCVYPAGDAATRSTFSDAQALRVYAAYKKGATVPELAAKFGIPKPSIHALVTGRTRRHLFVTQGGISPRLKTGIAKGIVKRVHQLNKNKVPVNKIATELAISYNQVKGIINGVGVYASYLPKPRKTKNPGGGVK